MNKLTTFNTTVESMDSREIAALTGKRHADVLVDIDKMLIELDISELKFEPRDYTDSRGKIQRCYSLDKELTTTKTKGLTL